MKPKPLPKANSRNVEEIVILPEKRQKNTKRFRINPTKMEHCKTSNLLNDSTISKSLTRKYMIYHQAFNILLTRI